MVLQSRAMRAGAWMALATAACAADPAPGPVAPLPIDTVWAQTIHPGDVVVLVPGTGSYDYLGAPIEALPGNNPDVDPRQIAKVGSDAIVFEQAIAAAHRAGVDPSELTFTLWGAGFTRLTSFTYVSYEGLRVPIEIIGGENSCATGLIVENLVKYNLTAADLDARDLYARTLARVGGGPDGRHVIISAHSWGGAVAEYLTQNLIDIESGGGAIGLSFTIAAGVPGMIPSYKFTGPGLRAFDGVQMLEIDRPDDPVHALDPSGNPSGHQYVILYGDDFQGAYGVTTEELACAGIPGECARR
jgi:hypothetical protein